MKAAKILIIFITSNVSMNIFSQVNPIIIEKELTQNENLAIKKYVNNYQVISFNNSEILDSLKEWRKCNILLSVDTTFNWEFELNINDLRAYNFKATYITDTGIIEFQDYQPNTYKGKTKDGKIVRFTIDEKEFSGIILDENSYFIIEPIKKFIGTTSKDTYLCYESKDIVRSDIYNLNSISDAIIITDSIIKSMNLFKAALCTYYLEIATDADYEFYQDMGCDNTVVYSNIFSTLNIIEGVYESTFDLRFVVTFQNVWNISNDPYTTSDSHDLLNEFRDEWNYNRTEVIRDIAHLFSGKTLDDFIIGRAFKGHIIGSYAYSLSMNRTEMFETTAHEIGHNFDASDNPSDGYCGTDIAAVMCQGIKDNNLWFSSISINEITPFLSYYSVFLANPIPQQLVLSGSVNGFNEFQARVNITSTQIIESGFAIYKSNDVILNAGFETKIGCQFEIINDDSGCY